MHIKSSEDYEKQRDRQVSRMRSGLDYAMGALMIFIGLFLAFRSKLDIGLNKTFPPDKWDMVYGAIVIIYGAWRIYRGYKKNYFK